MNKNTKIWTGGICVLVILLGVFLWYQKSGSHRSVAIPTASISDGTIDIAYSSDTFGLGVNREQVLVTSYIPPCNENFNYCFYYIGKDYEDTNFDSAGLRMVKRMDLTNEQSCLQTPPNGYETSVLPAATTSMDKYAAAFFPQLGDAAAGHYAEGELYRLYLRDKLYCYEFETLVAETRFENYEKGDVEQFTKEDKARVEQLLKGVLRSVSITDGPQIDFPR